MINCIVWVVLAVVIAGVLVWGMQALPLDPTVKQIGKVAIIIIFVIMLAYVVMSCLGLHAGALPHP